jgi:TolA-binding protein
VTALSRDEARLDGEIGQLEASLADISDKIAETSLQRLNIDQQTVAGASHDLYRFMSFETHAASA